jgi:dTDP-4-dehydrorhamnose 3,5-epimerase
MKVVRTSIPEVLILEPKVFSDNRGFFMESYNQRAFQEATGSASAFVQDNHSRSAQNVLRGLHYQIQQPQGKLIRVIAGEVFDVAVDIRKTSATFGQWIGVNLSAENRLQMWIPPGFAHGFLVLSQFAEVLYKTTDFYAPAYECCIRLDDPDIGIEWPLKGASVLSQKDRQGASLREAPLFD